MVKDMRQTFCTNSTLESGEQQAEEHGSELVMVPHEVSLDELQELVFADIEFPITIDLDTDMIL
jgi:hypothetical protein